MLPPLLPCLRCGFPVEVLGDQGWHALVGALCDICYARACLTTRRETLARTGWPADIGREAWG